jgi:hypothetical protein
MRDLPRIIALYLEIDSELEAHHSNATAAGDAAAVQRIESKLRIND